MIKGTVNRDIEPTLSVEIVRRDGHTLSVDATLDTGFSGDLLLSSETIRQAELSLFDQVAAVLADGRLTTMDSWRGTILWHGRPRSMVVLESDGDPLLRMNLLRGNRVTLDVLESGDVIIDELQPT